jgi:hypothetical protein
MRGRGVSDSGRMGEGAKGEFENLKMGEFENK